MLYNTGGKQEELQEAHLTIMEDGECTSQSDNKLCAGGTDGAGVCAVRVDGIN